MVGGGVMIQQLTIFATPGETSVSHFLLFNVRKTILVTREGLPQHEVQATPGMGTSEYQYDPGGTIYFDPFNPFPGPTFGRINRYLLTRIFILYEI